MGGVGRKPGHAQQRGGAVYAQRIHLNLSHAVEGLIRCIVGDAGIGPGQIHTIQQEKFGGYLALRRNIGGQPEVSGFQMGGFILAEIIHRHA